VPGVQQELQSMKTIIWPCACGCLCALYVNGPRVVCWHCKSELPMFTLENDDDDC